MVEVGGSNPPGPTKMTNPAYRRGFFVLEGYGLAGEALFDKRDQGAFGPPQQAQAPEGFNRQRQWRLKTIRLVLPNF